MLYPDFNELIQLKAKVSNLNLLSNRVAKSVISGDYFSMFRGHGLEFEEVREYIPGDDIRKIDWRVTARTGVPHVKVFTEEKDLNVLILVDMNASMRFGTRGTFKSIQAARCAALLGWCANKNSNKVGACLFGDLEEEIKYFKPKRSRYSLWQMLRLLCQHNFQDQDKSISLIKTIEFINKIISLNSLVFIISDFMNINDQLNNQLKLLNKKSQVTLISVNDPADMEISPAGNILFSCFDSPSVHVDTTNIHGQKIYKQQWEERVDRLKNILINLGISHISLFTNRDVYLDLFYGLKDMVKWRKK